MTCDLFESGNFLTQKHLTELPLTADSGKSNQEKIRLVIELCAYKK